MWLHRILAVALVGVVAVVAPFAAPAAAAECTDPGQDITTVPWAQQNLGASDVWALTRGGGITVAVLESGVDAAHPQLSGRVAAGVDAVAGTGPANTDCVGTGTQVAGVIAGKVTNGIGFTGVAPLARILPVRVVADRQTGGAQAAQLAKGINAAVDAGADVIDVAVPTYTDDPAVRAAVQKALGKQIVVVAAVGDLGGANQQNPTPTRPPTTVSSASAPSTSAASGWTARSSASMSTSSHPAATSSRCSGPPVSRSSTARAWHRDSSAPSSLSCAPSSRGRTSRR
ncbi:hypothetical protein GCM10027610_090840 [Dactylosporangium cerinum]